MNILYVNNQVRLGGAETVVHQLLRGFPGSRLKVAFGKTYPDWVEPMYPRSLSRLDHSRFHRTVERFASREAWTDRVFRSLAKDRADLIHLHNFHGDYASVESLAYVAERKPLVWTFHAFWGMTGGCDHPRDCTRYNESCGACPQLGQWPIGPVDRTAEQLARKLRTIGEVPMQIVAPSSFLAERVAVSRMARKWSVHHIPNGVDVAGVGYLRKHDPSFRRALGIDPDAIVVLLVNRDFAKHEKGYGIARTALEAISGLRGVHLVLIGANVEAARCELPAGITVTCREYISDRAELLAWYEAADIFLFASPAENFPCVVLEAMAAKCCVVATPTGGVPEQVENGSSGLLAKAIEGRALAEVLKAAIESKEFRTRMGDAARARVEAEFPENLMVARHAALYEKLR